MLIKLIFAALAFVANGQSQQCHVRGQCSGGSLVGFSASDSYISCMQHCRTNPQCNWFTHLGDTDQCLEYSDCDGNIDASVCNNCFSGEVVCAACNMRGFCSGHFVAANNTETEQGCQKFCQITEGCKWFSFAPETRDCVLTEDCIFFDQESCSNCVAGERQCPILSEKMMVVGSNFQSSAKYKAEVVEMSGEGLNCSRPADYPFEGGMVGTFIGGMAMLCGGQNGSRAQTNRFFNYDSVSDLWEETYSMETERWMPAAVMLSDTQWWITGGKNNGTSALTSTEIFTVDKGFSSFVNLPEAKHSHNLIKVDETHFVLLGGYTETTKAWMFDMTSQLWTDLPDLIVRTDSAQAGLITHPNGTVEVVVAAGGYYNDVTQVLDLDTMVWRKMKDFPPDEAFSEAFLEYGASVPYGQTFLVVGGKVNGYPKRAVFRYLTEEGGWVEQPRGMDVARDAFAAFLVPEDLVQCS